MKKTYRARPGKLKRYLSGYRPQSLEELGQPSDADRRWRAQAYRAWLRPRVRLDQECLRYEVRQRLIALRHAERRVKECEATIDAARNSYQRRKAKEALREAQRALEKAQDAFSDKSDILRAALEASVDRRLSAGRDAPQLILGDGTVIKSGARVGELRAAIESAIANASEIKSAPPTQKPIDTITAPR